MDNENKEQKLTDEEVWLLAYCASMIDYDRVWRDDADFALKEFKQKFRKNNG